MNSPCGNEDLLLLDPYGIMKEGKGGKNSIERKGSCPFQRIQGPVLLPPATEAETTPLGNFFHGAQAVTKNEKGQSCCLFSKHGGRSV